MAMSPAPLACLLVCSAALVGGEARTIPNQLKLAWPWDLVSLDFPGGSLREPLAVRIDGLEQPRPGQIEHATVDGKPVDRLWFICTATGGKDRIGIEVVPGATAASTLAIRDEGGFTVIDNGVAEFRLATYGQVAGKRFDQIPHWTGGMRAKGEPAWDGRAWFNGSSQVASVTTTWISRGPVFADVRIDYRFADEGGTGEVDAVPLLLGKHSFRWPPNVIPTERVAKRERAYSVAIRVVAGDPWIEVSERYRLPADPSVADYGIHQQTIHWGRPAGEAAKVAAIPADQFAALDTVTWVRWFLYDTFGGNVDQNWVPARPREDQKGRPFALLRPRWNQGGGGAQDFVLTRGGAPAKDKQPDDQVPAFGVIAAYASKWVGPYRATIAANAYDGERGQCRFPLGDGGGGGGNDGDSQSNWYGSRCFALVVGRRKDIGSLNNLVRRHTDWTLNAQANAYILDWPRDAAKAGPNILLSKSDFERIRREVAAGSGGEQAKAVLAAKAEYAALRGELAALGEVKGDKAKEAQAGAIRKKLDAPDMQLLRVLLGEDIKPPQPPSPNLWVERRYQDDFLNPTSGALRRMPPAWGMVDLMAGGKPVGGPWQAAMGYILTDLDAWPGWHNGWTPGNPNFHTDKYMPGVMAGAAMRDHPHADRWLAYGLANLTEDLGRVLWAPDGAGQECPGYAGYSFKLQMETARMYRNLGTGNAISGNALTKGFGRQQRLLITPFDKRIGRRHAAPIGDTHRWDSGLGGEGFRMLAGFWREADPAFTAECLAAAGLLPKGKSERGLKGEITVDDPGVPPADPATLDWSSRHFYGFGAIMRHGGIDATFLTAKAGPARGHDHNSELSFHFYAGGTPIALDYNCSYHPRGDSASLHNSMTFGRRGSLQANKSQAQFATQEELNATASVGAFAGSPVADVLAAERVDDTLVQYPIEPTDEFGRSWPTRTPARPIVHRRFSILVKQPSGSPMQDYLVVRDETDTDEPQQVNVHVLARDAVAGPTGVRFAGQWDKDADLHLVEATEPRIDLGQWHYHDEWMLSPGDEYVVKPGETTADWAKRMESLKQAKGWTSIPGPDFKPRYKRGGKGGDPGVEEDAKAAADWEHTITATDGRALIPPPGWSQTWTWGEQQQWARISTKPGTPVLWALIPRAAGAAAPTVERIADGHGLRVSLGGRSDEITCSTERGVQIVRGGATTVLIKPSELPALGKIPRGVPPAINRPAAP
jgi:hypothetical protein